MAGEAGKEQALDDEVRIAAIGGGGVAVIIDREAEMPAELLIGRFDDVLAGTEKLHDREREMFKLGGAGDAPGREKISQRFGLGRLGQFDAVAAVELAETVP